MEKKHNINYVIQFYKINLKRYKRLKSSLGVERYDLLIKMGFKAFKISFKSI